MIICCFFLVACSRGDKETEQKQEHVHEWTAATCMSPKTCAVCNEEEGEALGHSWKIKDIIEAACKEQGYTNYECERCKAIEKRDIKEKLKHSWQAKDNLEGRIMPRTRQGVLSKHSPEASLSFGLR